MPNKRRGPEAKYSCQSASHTSVIRHIYPNT